MKLLKSRLILLIVVAIIFTGIGVVAIGVKASDIEYKNGTVQDAIDDLYTRANSSSGSNMKFYFDGTLVDGMPDRNSSAFHSAQCDNQVVAEFDSANRKFTFSNVGEEGVSCNLYFISGGAVYQLFAESIDNENALNGLLSDSDNLSQLVDLDNEQLLINLLESQAFRNALYNNYTVVEPVIASSPLFLSAMQKTTRYEVISRTGQNKDFYNSRAFVLGLSCEKESSGDYKTGSFLSDNGDIMWKPKNYYSTTGLAYSVNKFASSVYVKGIYGTSLGWGNAMYAAIFKI